MAETAVETGKRGRKAAIKAEKAAEAAEEPKPKGRAARATAETPTFWQKVAQVAKADWGPRANIYLYRVEPVIDRRRAGSQTYITKYAEPISEDRILADHGSGRYKLMLNFRKPGAEQGDEVDSVYIDLLNPQFPPKIAPGEWVDDPNNKKWAWAKQHFPNENKTQDVSGTIMDALEIADKLRPASNPVKDTLDTIKGVRDLLPSAPQKTAAEELQTLVTVAEKLRPTETVPAFVQAQFAALQAQIAAAQERGDKLMMMVIEGRKTENSGGFGIVKELVGGLKELIPEVKGLFPSTEDGGFIGRTRMNGWQEFAIQVAPHLAPALSPLFQGLAARFLMPQPTNGIGHVLHQPNPPQHPQQLPPGPGPTPMMMPFLQSIAYPMQTFIRYIGPPENEDPESVGKDFAAWVWNGYGANPQYGAAITAARGMGPLGIIAAFKTTPMWGDKGPQNTLPSLQELEPKLTPFFTAFLAFDPEAPEGDEPEETSEPEVLTYSGR